MTTPNAGPGHGEDWELYNLLSLPSRSYNKKGIIERVQYLLKRYLDRIYGNGTGNGWNALQQRCDICNKMLPSAQELITHRILHTSEFEHRFICLLCNDYCTLSNKQNLCKHILQMHNDEGNTPRKRRRRNKLHYCHLCKKWIVNLKDHNRRHTGEKPFRCRVCARGFTRAEHLTLHTRIHTKEKPYKCDKCDRSFTQTASLNQHKRLHTGERPYQCKICEKCFAHSTTLTQHMKTHTGEKPYECDICHKFFTQLSNLNTHRKFHTGEKPYKCTICNKTCSQRSNLTSHMKTHIKKQIKCKMCDRLIAHYYFKRHMHDIHDTTI